MKNFKIFSLGSNPVLAGGIAKELGLELGAVKTEPFADGEQYVQFQENLRGRKVFLIQSTNQPDGNIMQLLIGLQAARLAGGKPVPVIPYFGYGRQERKSAPREPITTSLLVSLYEQAGAKREILTMDLHANATEGFARKSVFNQIYARPVFLKFFEEFFKRELRDGKFVIGSPDASGAGPGRARSYAKRLGEKTNTTIPLVVVDKRREDHDMVEVNYILGKVKGKVVVFTDDILGTGGTFVKAAQAALDEGALEVYGAATHAVFAGTALEKITNSPFKKVFIADTIYNPKVFEAAVQPGSKIQIISVAKIFADAIRNIVNKESVSQLFD